MSGPEAHDENREREPSTDEKSGSSAADPFGLAAEGSPVPGHQPQAVGFLLSQLGYEIAGRFRSLMAEVELEPRQFALMRGIDFAEGMAQNSVAEFLRIPASSMVALIDQLEARDLVERRQHPTDRRSRTLHITDHGREVLARATELAMQLELTICGGFDPEKRQQLLEMLVRVTDNLGLVQGLHPGSTKSHFDPHWSDHQVDP